MEKDNTELKYVTVALEHHQHGHPPQEIYVNIIEDDDDGEEARGKEEAEREEPACSRLAFRLLLVWLVVCGLVFLYTYTAYVGPYFQATRYTGAQCTVVRANYTWDSPHVCHCGSDVDNCSSTFPCAEVVVKLNNVEDEPTVQIYRRISDMKQGHTQCSIRVCETNPLDNAFAIESFMAEYGQVGDSYACSYDPNNLGQVLIEVHTTFTVVMHCILWPVLGMVTGVLLFLVMHITGRWDMVPPPRVACCK